MRLPMRTSDGQKQMVIEAISQDAKGYILKPPRKAFVCNFVCNKVKSV